MSKITQPGHERVGSLNLDHSIGWSPKGTDRHNQRYAEREERGLTQSAAHSCDTHSTPVQRQLSPVSPPGLEFQVEAELQEGDTRAPRPTEGEGGGR